MSRTNSSGPLEPVIGCFRNGQVTFTVMNSRRARAAERPLDSENEIQVKGYERESDEMVTGGAEWVFVI